MSPRELAHYVSNPGFYLVSGQCWTAHGKTRRVKQRAKAFTAIRLQKQDKASEDLPDY